MPDPALACLAASVAAVVVLVPGYAVWLRRISGVEPPAQSPSSDAHARLASELTVEIVVAARNEADWIEEKLRDLAALDSPPGGLVFWIVDGASTDGTAEIVERWAARDPRFRLLRTGLGDKSSGMFLLGTFVTSNFDSATQQDIIDDIDFFLFPEVDPAHGQDAIEDP